MNRAVFVDRDGTLIVDKEYLADPEEVEVLSNVSLALKKLTDAGYRLIIITNQSGVGRGYFTEAQVKAVNDKVVSILAEEGVTVHGVYYCLHHPDEVCECRKPAAGLLLRAADEQDIALAESSMIGDKAIDIKAGCAAGCRWSIRIASEPDPLADFTAEDLPSAVDWLIHAERGSTSSRFNWFISATCLLASLAIILVIHAYATYGGPWVDSLDEQIGEIVSRRARMAAQAGKPADAIALYEQALQQHFDDPRQRVWTLERFADLLKSEGRPAEAFQILKRAAVLDPGNPKIHWQLTQAAFEAGAYEEVVAVANDWFTIAEKLGRNDQMSDAKYYEALANERLGLMAAALEAFEATFQYRPSAKTALAAAKVLHALNRHSEAARYLSYATKHGTGSIRRDALSLAEAH